MRKFLRNLKQILLIISLLLTIFSRVFALDVLAYLPEDKRFTPKLAGPPYEESHIENIEKFIAQQIPDLFDKDLYRYALVRATTGGHYLLVVYPTFKNVQSASTIKYSHDGKESQTPASTTTTTCTVTNWDSGTVNNPDREAQQWKCNTSNPQTNSQNGLDYSQVLYPVRDTVEWNYHAFYNTSDGKYRLMDGLTTFANQNGDTLYSYEPNVYKFDSAGGYLQTNGAADLKWYQDNYLLGFLATNIDILTGTSIIYAGWGWNLRGYNFETSLQNDHDFIKKQNDQTRDSIDKIGTTITDPNVDTSTGGDFFNGFQSDSHGLTSIVSAPLQLIKNINNNSCTDVPLPLPYIDKKLMLPCMTSIYNQMFGGFLILWQTITTGFISYYVTVRLFSTVKNIKDPNNQDIEVADL